VATREKRKLTVGRAARATNGAPVVGPPRASGYRVGRVIGPILLDILLPILAMIALGAWLRWKFHVDLSTLTKLNIYLFVPAFVFQKVATSTLPWADMGGVVAVTVLQVIALGAIVWAVGRALRVGRKTLAAVALAVMFYNSGNYGLPLAELAYPAGADVVAGAGAGAGAAHKDGAAAQAFVVLTQNVLTFTVGLCIAATAHHGDLGRALLRILRMPVLYVLAAALGARLWLDGDPSRALPTVIAKPAEYLAAGLVPIALVTLGAQLASNPRWPRWRPVSLVLFLRLVFAPALMAAMLYGFHLLGLGPLDLWPWPAEMLVLTASVPTAVNTLLLTMELDGDSVLAADCVFWTTVFSCATITGWLLVIRWYFAP
jgi:predicted permease